MPLLQRGATGKRGGPVEAVIAWAWREELPKVPRRMDGPMQMVGGWDKTGRFAEMLSLVDSFGVNQYGAVPDFSADSWPCRDAQLVGNAVMALDDCSLELPEDWRPAPELDRFGGLGVKAVSEAWRRMTRDDGQGGQVLRLKPSELVIRRAVMGVDLGDMEIEGVEQRYETFANGQERWFVRNTVHTIVGANPDGSDRTQQQEVEMSGWNSSTRRPLPGAYRKPVLDPDPVDAIVARAEHEIWLSALAAVYDTVVDDLEEIEVRQTTIPVQPWLVQARAGRVLPDLIAADAYARAEREAIDARFAARFPRWFKALQKQAAKILDGPA